MKRLLHVTPLCAVAFTYLLAITQLMGCRQKPRAPDAGVPVPPGTLIAVIGPARTDASWRGIAGGAQRYAHTHRDIQCLPVVPDNEEPTALNAVLTELLTHNPAAICLCVDNPAVAAMAAQRILARGILLVTAGQPLEAVAAYGQVEVAWTDAAEQLAANLDEIAAGRRSYILVHDDGRDRLASQCYARFIGTARTRSKLALLEERNVAASKQPRRDAVQELLGMFPNVGLVVTLDPQVWLSRQPRFRLPPENRFATLSAAPLLWPRLRSGEAAALAGPLDGDIGYAAVELAVDGLMQIPDAQKRRIIGCELVTPATLDDFARRYAAAAGMDVAELLPTGATTAPASP